MKLFHPFWFFALCWFVPHTGFTEGSLFIIGGGARPREMTREMVELSGVGQKGHVVILPWAARDFENWSTSSSDPILPDLEGMGVTRIHVLKIPELQKGSESERLLLTAGLVYIPGGSQRQFMDLIRNTDIGSMIRRAFENGSMIAGTSAGAAIQSELMLTGLQLNHPEWNGKGIFPTIEKENLEILEGLNLLPGTIIDQHFLKRQRLNRLISAVIQNPEFIGVGIDEATAIHVQHQRARVLGVGQVVVLRCEASKTRSTGRLQAVDSMPLSIHLPGDSFDLTPR